MHAFMEVSAQELSGREWHPAGELERVNVHDFADRGLGELIAATSDTGGLTVRCAVDANWCPTSERIIGTDDASPPTTGTARWTTPTAQSIPL